MAELADEPDFAGADAVLFDLGVSNLQLTEAERGFSFQNDGPLDMRMNAEDEAEGRTAADILAEADVAELTAIFRDYGEERYAFQIAKGIVRNPRARRNADDDGGARRTYQKNTSSASAA